MKRYIKIAVAALVLAMTFTGCKGGKDDQRQGTVQAEDISDKLTALGDEITELEKKAEEIYGQGKLSDDKYNAVMQLNARLAAIGSDGTNENMLKYNELKKLVDELKYDVSAAENPQETDNITALNSLMDCIDDVESALKTANEQGRLPDDRFALFNDYKAEVKGYIDGTNEWPDNLSDRLSEIRSDITTMASQAEADNTTIDKLLAEPVKVEDNTKLEELISNYIELQNEVQEKVNNGELPESKLTELMITGVKVAQVKEALQTGNITEQTKQIMQECSTELKVYAEGIGSSSAQYFE